MASRALAGFIGGFADTARAGLERRELEEAERRKAEMLNRLRLETDKELALFADKLEGKKVSKDNSSIDLERGVRVNRNAKGEVIGEVPLTPTELEANRLSLDESRLTIEDKRSTIDSRARDDARQDRYTDAMVRNLDSSGRKGDTATGDKGNKILLAEAERSFNNMADLINPAAVARFRAVFDDGVNTRGWSPAQQRTFLREMERRVLRENSGDYKGRPLSATHSIETRSLIPE